VADSLIRLEFPGSEQVPILAEQVRFPGSEAPKNMILRPEMRSKRWKGVEGAGRGAG